jgi:hypothetical protein
MKALLLNTARSGARGVASAVAITLVGVVFNVGAFITTLRAVGGSASLGWVSASLLVPLALAGSFLFSVAYLVLAQWYGRRVALRSWYEGNREVVLRAIDEAVRRASAATPGGVQNLSAAGWSRVAAGMRKAPRPVRTITGWVLKRAGVGGLLGMLEGHTDAAASARLDAFIRDEFLAVSTRPFWILFGVNAAVVVAVLLWIR